MHLNNFDFAFLFIFFSAELHWAVNLFGIIGDGANDPGLRHTEDVFRGSNRRPPQIVFLANGFELIVRLFANLTLEDEVPACEPPKHVTHHPARILVPHAAPDDACSAKERFVLAVENLEILDKRTYWNAQDNDPDAVPGLKRVKQRHVHLPPPLAIARVFAAANEEFVPVVHFVRRQERQQGCGRPGG